MAVLVGGLRVLGVASGTDLGVLTPSPGTALNNDFFVNLVDMSTTWEKAAGGNFVGKDAQSGAVRWNASHVDLIFGSNPELRAITEYYACDDAKAEFVADFGNAFAKVMNLDMVHFFR